MAISTTVAAKPPEKWTAYRHYAANKDYAKALTLLNKAAMAEPRNTDIALAKIRVLTWMGRYALANTALIHYLSLHAKDADAQFQLGLLRLYQGKTQEAQKIFQAILKQHPDYTDARTTLAKIQTPPQKPSIQTEWQTYRHYALAKDYHRALAILNSAEHLQPNNTDIALAKIRVYDWMGDYATADQLLTRYLVQHPFDADALYLQGLLRSHQGRETDAESIFEALLSIHADYTDARNSLEQLRNAKKTATPLTTKTSWQFTTGFEYSQLSKQTQTDWNQAFLTINHGLASGTTQLHSSLRRYDQFSSLDYELEAGIAQQFSPNLNVSLYAAVTPDADFRPSWRIGGNGALRLDGFGLGWLMPAWLSIDIRYDNYKTTDVITLNPGISIEPIQNWQLTGRWITIHQQQSNAVYGWLARLDGELTPNWRFYAGFSQAPETIAGVTINTKAYFTGLTINVILQQLSLQIGYTHEDREQAYIREAYHANINYRF